ncbi:STAS domain-containing protein [Zestomonas thermotolerans]|uniref:STAS domain-containing protein n=1 Tax=Zestomonas thermotolerans TaxID=157784 RepID=UPI0003653835|nr:STAS domain-containing protein [Pseudomonas thermotolerans]MBO2512173.1 STAS domain-containing protein [Gammaproteobacteria bacterium]
MEHCSESRLRLGGSFTIERAAELRELLLLDLERHRPESICLAGINDIDCAGLQLLIALRRQLPDVPFVAPSPAVEQLLARLHMTTLLDH